MQLVTEAWAESVEEISKRLASTLEGLGSEDIQQRSAQYGYNELPSARGRSTFRILLSQLQSPILWVLAIAGVITLFLQDWIDSTVIFGAVVVNAILGWYQEAKAEKTLELLKRYVKEHAKVVRGGKEMRIAARDLVPGDIVHLMQGDKVPADGRILVCTDLLVDESVLTGESLPVEKSTAAVDVATPLAERTCMVYGGSTVLQGEARVLLVATGLETELGRIARMVGNTQHEATPLQKALNRVTYQVTIVLGILAVFLFAYGIYQGRAPLEMFLISVATAVAAVPEGLPIALTVILAIGVERLAKRKGVVRRLLAAETLGSTTLILTDKTGTLTQARMELEEVVTLSKTLSQEHLLEYAVSHADVVIENPEEHPDVWRINGRPSEVALARSGARFGIEVAKVREAYEVVERLPFNSRDKYSASIVRTREGMQVLLLGAPEALLQHATVSAAQRAEVEEMVDRLTAGGARVLALAAHPIEAKGSLKEHVASKKAVLLGLLALRDPVRPSVKDAIARSAAAGVRTVIMTGDHAGTAAMVAREVGIDIDQPGAILLGSDIDALSDTELAGRLQVARVIARTTPEQKLRVVRIHKLRGETVAMTGDGVNDAPALREAHIGISLGTGTDVAKAAADLVLLDDNFETIVAAVEEGRNILQNVRRVTTYLLANSFDSLVLIGGSLALGIPLPLTTLQILWVNLFTDSLPATALAFERGHGDMGRGPIDVRHHLFDTELKFLVLVVGSITSMLLFGLYALLTYSGFDAALVRTFMFASFGTYTLFLAFSTRSLRKSIFELKPWGNPYLIAATVVGISMLVVAVYLPPLQMIFQTVSLPLNWALGVAIVGFASIAGVELGKFAFRFQQGR